MTPFRPNPSLYHRLATPRPRAEVEAAIAAFDADVRAARERHGIAELLIVCGAVVAPAEEGGREATAIATAHYGDPAMLPTLALAARNWARRAHMAMFDELFAAGADGGCEEAEDNEP